VEAVAVLDADDGVGEDLTTDKVPVAI